MRRQLNAGFALVLGAPLLAACDNRQSVLSPHGSGASEIAAIAWLLFALAAFVLIIVLVALWLAWRGPAHLRGYLAGKNSIYLGGIAFPVITLSGLLIYGVSLTQSLGERPNGEPALRVHITGEQWWWRMEYETDIGLVTGANELRIPVGEDVELVLTSADVIHSLWIPSLAGKVDMIPGRVNRLRLTAERAGIYRGSCAEYCGGPHALMAFTVVAMPTAEFTKWLDSQAAPAAVPESDTVHQGRELFIASGCGACHAIRGSEAIGVIGPDLTHFGSRRAVGIDTLPLNPENIGRFITDGQHIKPGNLMPPFRIFSPAELDALSEYLASLR